MYTVHMTKQLLSEFAAEVGMLLKEYRDKHEIPPAVLATKLLEIAKALPENKQPAKLQAKSIRGI
jgi:hypothetical protein